ncbi:MAG: HIT family protein [Methanocorpusculum sp.]|nr:HIT family protein [Methanocorpusculum sp.]
MLCPFCVPEDEVFGNGLAYAKMDTYPVSKGHMLIIPRRHADTWFDLTAEEQTAVMQLAEIAKRYLDEFYSPNGYNLGLNCGVSAGQTIMHAHLHLIPRYIGDVPNPRGGIRAVIAAKKEYP